VSTGLPDSWYKRLPSIDEKDLEEKAIKGSGPGGQSINKTHNCCQIKHIPTGDKTRRILYFNEKIICLGFVVTCQQTRFLEKNRVLARRQLQEKLDVYYNGEQSLVAQYKREKNEKKEAKRLETNKTLEKKRAFKSEQDIYSNDKSIE
jgi:protein subunit release factor B